MPAEKPRFLLVDTNCFIRLYGSPVMPLMRQTFGGYLLLTLQSLIDEFKDNKDLAGRYPWVTQEPRLSDLIGSRLKLSGITKRLVEKQLRSLEPYAKTFLATDSKKKGISPPKRLSTQDLELLSTAVVLKGVVATDEWPMTLVIKDLMAEPEEYAIGVLNSIEVLHLLESSGALTSDIRKQTVSAWVSLGEKLPRDWRSDYERLFGEPADEAHSAVQLVEEAG